MLINCDGERQPWTIIANNVDGVLGGISARDNSMEVDQRSLQPLRLTEAGIVWVTGFRPVLTAAVPIAEQSILTEGVVVRAILPFENRHSRDAEGQPANSRLEDALRAEQGNALTLEREPGGEERPAEHITAQTMLLIQERESREPYAKVGVVHGREILRVVIERTADSVSQDRRSLRVGPLLSHPLR